MPICADSIMATKRYDSVVKIVYQRLEMRLGLKQKVQTNLEKSHWNDECYQSTDQLFRRMVTR